MLKSINMELFLSLTIVFLFTASKWITFKTAYAATSWHMIYYRAFSIGCTGSCARIATMLFDASQRRRTFRIVNTFRTTARCVRITNVWFYALAASYAITFATNGIFSARMWIARINMIFWF